MSNTSPSLTNNDVNEKMENWFENLVAGIRKDHLMLETNTAPENTTNLYNTLMNGTQTELFATTRGASSKYFIQTLLNDYFAELKKYKRSPLKMALDLSDAKVLVWAEIEDNDEETENTLILSEAKANAKYAAYGFYITSTIVDKTDNLAIPNHYQKVKA